MANNLNSYVEFKVLNKKALWDRFKKENPKYKDVRSVEMKKNIDLFFNEAANLITEKQDGIILNMLGYFANPAYQKRMFTDGYNEQTANTDAILTQGLIYKSMFFPTVFTHNKLNQWLFSITRHKARKMAREVIDNGVRYRCHSNFLKTIVKDRKYLFTDNE